MPTIYLIRHGVTGANKEKRFAGRSQEPLHADGIEQIRGLAARLGDKGIGRIVAGPLPRTRQSAEIIGDVLGVPVATNDAFNEILLPHWDELTKDEIRARFGDEYPTWLADPAGFEVAGCETIAAVQQRAVRAMEQLFADNDQPILVVTHLIVARALILHYRRQPIADFRAIAVGNGALVTFRRTDDGATEIFQTA
ncbi:MAG: histidine phosphatase family protein [Desulfobulbaceae bacterium]|nr:histidine phosphatase family protein [Desulfobulbaceae bacterium]